MIQLVKTRRPHLEVRMKTMKTSGDDHEDVRPSDQKNKFKKILSPNHQAKPTITLSLKKENIPKHHQKKTFPKKTYTHPKTSQTFAKSAPPPAGKKKPSRQKPGDKAARMALMAKILYLWGVRHKKTRPLVNIW